MVNFVTRKLLRKSKVKTWYYKTKSRCVHCAYTYNSVYADMLVAEVLGLFPESGRSRWLQFSRCWKVFCIPAWSLLLFWWLSDVALPGSMPAFQAARRVCRGTAGRSFLGFSTSLPRCFLRVVPLTAVHTFVSCTHNQFSSHKDMMKSVSDTCLLHGVSWLERPCGQTESIWEFRFGVWVSG